MSSGEYGPHTDAMVAAVENGKCQRWREYGVDSIPQFQNNEIEQLNTGGVESHNYKRGSTSCQQFYILMKRMLLQTIRNRVRKLLI